MKSAEILLAIIGVLCLLFGCVDMFYFCKREKVADLAHGFIFWMIAMTVGYYLGF